MNIHKRAKPKRNYPTLEVGDNLNVRVPVIHKQHKGYRDQISTEIHKVMDKRRVLSMVDGLLHSRKDLQCVKGNII